MQINPFQRQCNILDYALSSLWRRKLKNAGILVIFSLVIFLVASFQLLTRSLLGTADEILAFAPDITLQKLSAGRQVDMSEARLAHLAGIFGIAETMPRIWGYYFDETNGANYTVIGLAEEKIAAAGFPLTGQEETGFLKRGGVIMSPAVRDNMGLGERRAFSLFRPDLSQVSFRVAGVFSKETNLVSGDTILMCLEDARDLFALDDNAVTDIAIYVTNPLEIDNIARKIAEMMPDTRVLTRSQIRKTYQAVFGWRSGFGSICLLSALASFVILAWDKASGLSQEEKREIGILKFLGFETRDILALRFWESGLVSGLALVIGLTLAYIHVASGGALFQPILLGWSVLRPELFLTPALQFSDFLLLFSFSVLPYLAATIIPAWRSAIIRADTVI
ncbi:MAG: FtsX-like permease family protein [Desulfobulbaceae bacterium]|nr:FtsX-like permease family protein [Desulfobulbaceae bacterium]